MVHPAVLLPHYNVHSDCVSTVVTVIYPEGFYFCTVFPTGLVTLLLVIKEVGAENDDSM